MFFYYTGGAGAAPITRNSPLSAIVSGAVFDLDATIADSYTTGQIWANLIPSPADGSAQAAYDFTRGASTGASTDDPTFTGAAGDSAAYFACDGGDFFGKETDNTTFLNNLHRTDVTQPFTIGYVVRTPPAGTGVAGLCTARLLASDGGAGIATAGIVGNWSGLGITGDSGNARLLHNFPPAIAVSTDYLFIMSYDPATNAVRSWINGTRRNATLTKNASVNNPPDAKCSIGRYSGGAVVSSSGTRYYAAFMLNEFIDDTEREAIRAHYELRHGRAYT